MCYASAALQARAGLYFQSLDLLQQRILMQPAHTQQVMALAHFSDGSIRDVTIEVDGRLVMKDGALVI